MSVQVITGYTGTKHITPADDAAFNRGVVGENQLTTAFSLPVLDECDLTIISNTSVRVKSGVLVVQGRFGVVSQEDLTLNSIATNKSRIDLIICRYTHDSITLIDNMELAVVQGTPVNYGNTPTAPTITAGDLDSGATTAEFKLFRVELDNNAGTITAKKFVELVNTPSLYDLASVEYTVNNMDDYVVDEGTDANGWKYRKWHSGRMEAHVYLNSLTTSDYGTATTVSGVSRRQLNSIPTVPTAFLTLDYCAASGNNSGAWIVGGLNASDQPIVYQQAVSGTNVVARVCIELKGTWR